ncbi:MAG: C39 family peptidase [Polyangia bacterium]
MRRIALGIAIIWATGCGAPPSLQDPGTLKPGATDDGGSVVAADDLGTLSPGDGGVADDLAKAPPADMAEAPSPDMAKPAPPKKKVLPFVWQGENDYYMCGPSAARMALSSRISNLPSQSALANYMGTTTNGTDDIGLVRGALNHYFGITSYQENDIPGDSPTTAEQAALKKALVASIDAGYAMVANVVSGWRPPSYPPGTIYHYVAVIGYDASGDQALIADPAATGCGNGMCGNPASDWYGVPKSYWIATSDLGVWIAEKGYTFRP